MLTRKLAVDLKNTFFTLYHLFQKDSDDRALSISLDMSLFYHPVSLSEMLIFYKDFLLDFVFKPLTTLRPLTES